MKFKDIKDLCINPLKAEICYTGEIKTLDIYYSNKEYDNAEIVKITNKGIVLKAPDKYENIKEYIITTKLNGSEEIIFYNACNEIGITIKDRLPIGEEQPPEIEIINAKTLEEKIEVLKILYGGNDE